MSHHRLVVGEDAAGRRLDLWLASFEFIPSRARANELIQLGAVTLAGRAIKPSLKLRPGMIFEVTLPELRPSTLEADPAPLDILFQDDDVAVINKPSGLVVHPAAGHAQSTLVNRLIYHLNNLSLGFGERRPGIVHRLDRDTSGLLVVAKNDVAHLHLAAQFRAKTATRLYWALTNGQPKLPNGRIATRLARHPSDRKRFASTKDSHKGKLAITNYRVLARRGEVSWLECRLETGRTHQIRVHLAEAGSAIIADSIYGPKRRSPADREVGRLGLHAYHLGFVHPRTSKALTFQIGWPESLAMYAESKGFGA